MLRKYSKNPSTVVFRCINIVDRQRVDISVTQVGDGEHVSSYAQLEHKYIVPGTFYEVSHDVVVQVSKGAVFDLATAMRRNRLDFNELNVRALLHNILRALLHCEKRLSKPFRLTVADILVFREVHAASHNTWIFKLKNCFYENQYDAVGLVPAPEPVSPHRSFLTNTCVIRAIVQLGTIVFDACKNVYGYVAPLELMSSERYSASLRYVVNCMMYYKVSRSPPKIKELLLFFQTPHELHSEKLRSALFEGVKLNRLMITRTGYCVGRRKSCFF